MLRKINIDSVIEEICRKSDTEEIIIYGAGNYGKTMQRYLKTKYNTDIKCFAVSTTEKIKSGTLGEKEIIHIDELISDKKKYQLIVAVAEQKHDVFLKTALKLGFENIYLILNEFLRYMQSQLNVKRLEPLEKLRFEVHVTEHCNLNCKGCYHFSPLSKESFLSVEEFEKDIKQMAMLCDGQALSISLLGGEPLLHPQVIDFFGITRRYFKDCRIKLLTNGTLFNQMGEDFWQSCVENNVTLFCTKYPVHVDYDEIEKTAGRYDLEISYHNDLGAGQKSLIKYPFDITGSQPIDWNYEHCTRSNKCLTLKHGRLFTCPMAAHAHIAKEFFDLDMELSVEDSIDIYSAESYEEIASFLTKPIPFCRYCNLKITPEQQEWSVSKKNISEWF